MDNCLERYSCSWSEDSVRLIHTPAPAIKNTFFYIQETGYFKTTPPYFTERENLDSFLVVITLSGCGRLLSDGAEYLLKQGDIFWIHCMSHHYYECPEGCEWEFIWFHFHGGSSHGFHRAFTQASLPVLSAIPPDTTGRLIRDMQAIITLVPQRNYSSDIKISHHIHAVLTTLILAAQKEGSETFAAPEHIKAIIKELDTRYRQKIPLDYLAKKYGISKFHLARQFRQYTGIPIGEYIITLRINHAKELLKYSDRTINEIAASCGTPNTSHFIRIFKAREGRTPLQYRNEWN